MPITIAQALQRATQSQNIERLDAQLLLLRVLKRDTGQRAWLQGHDDQYLSVSQQQQFEQLCIQRQDYVPIAYLLGEREFFGLKLNVTSAVLDPRPDTETIVEWGLHCIKDITHPRVLDLGTGSGAIALALQSQRPDAQIWAVDASAEALVVAQNNAKQLHLAVNFLSVGSWFEPVAQEKLRDFDLIVSNPPYIAADDPHIPMLKHEPQAALISAQDGLEDLQSIVLGAKEYLRPGGWLLLEHGWQQDQAVQALLLQQKYLCVQSRQDLAGNIRCSGGICDQ